MKQKHSRTEAKRKKLKETKAFRERRHPRMQSVMQNIFCYYQTNAKKTSSHAQYVSDHNGKIPLKIPTFGRIKIWMTYKI